MFGGFLTIDNNGVRRLENETARVRLGVNLRCTRREFWPSALNVLEALQIGSAAGRARRLGALEALANGNLALTLPAEVLRRIAEAYARGEPTVIYSDQSVTALLREPQDVSASQLSDVREYLQEQEASFRAVHDRAYRELRPAMLAAGGISTWPNVATYLDEVWSTPDHLEPYARALWDMWRLDGPPPIERLLKHPAWRIFFEGWGAAFYGHSLARPAMRWTETADLQQLVYLGITPNGLLATDDTGLLAMGTAILRGRYSLREVVPVDAILT